MLARRCPCEVLVFITAPRGFLRPSRSSPERNASSFAFLKLFPLIPRCSPLIGSRLVIKLLHDRKPIAASTSVVRVSDLVCA